MGIKKAVIVKGLSLEQKQAIIDHFSDHNPQFSKHILDSAEALFFEYRDGKPFAVTHSNSADYARKQARWYADKYRLVEVELQTKYIITEKPQPPKTILVEGMEYELVGPAIRSDC